MLSNVVPSELLYDEVIISQGYIQIETATSVCSELFMEISIVALNVLPKYLYVEVIVSQMDMD